MRFTAVAALVAFLALSALPAQSQKGTLRSYDPPVILDTHHSSRTVVRPSGVTATQVVDLVVPDGGWVFAIDFGERSNQPCYLALRWATIDNGEMSFASSPFNECSGMPTGESLKSVGLYATDDNPRPRWVVRSGWDVVNMPLDWLGYNVNQALEENIPRNPRPTTSDGAPIALKSLGICRSRWNSEMKGLQVQGVSLQQGPDRINTRPIYEFVGNSQDDPEWETDRYERPNCQDWLLLQSCPNGQVLIGTRIHYDVSTGGRHRAKITGLAPICTRITTES